MFIQFFLSCTVSLTSVLRYHRQQSQYKNGFLNTKSKKAMLLNLVNAKSTEIFQCKVEGGTKLQSAL